MLAKCLPLVSGPHVASGLSPTPCDGSVCFCSRREWGPAFGCPPQGLPESSGVRAAPGCCGHWGRACPKGRGGGCRAGACPGLGFPWAQGEGLTSPTASLGPCRDICRSLERGGSCCEPPLVACGCHRIKAEARSAAGQGSETADPRSLWHSKSSWPCPSPWQCLLESHAHGQPLAICSWI